MSVTEFTEKLVECQNEMWRFAYSLTADYNDACDLLQETSLKALVNRCLFVDDGNFKGWVCTIMHNLFISNRRQTEYRLSVLEPLPDDIFSSVWNERCEEDAALLDANECREINRIYKAVPKEERQAFSYFAIGYKYREIAEMMHLPMGTVKSRIYNTRRRLQELLKDFVG